MIDLLSIKWDVPNNIEQFDLEKFNVYAEIKNLENKVVYNSSSWTDAHHGHLVIPQKCELNVTVTAINKCSREGSVSDRIEWIQGESDVVALGQESSEIGIQPKLMTTDQVQHASNDLLTNGKF